MVNTENNTNSTKNINTAAPKIPDGLEDSKIKTEVTNFASEFKRKLEMIEDLATLEILMPVAARMKERLKTLTKLGQARSIKIMGEWKTTPPKFHMRGLNGKKQSNETYQVSFEVYNMDKKRNKIPKKIYVDEETSDGNTTKKKLNAIDYSISYKVIETITQGKNISRKILMFDKEEN